MLDIQSASLSSGNIRRVDDVSLACEPGTITAMLGPNGAGKTSLLRLLAGDLKADRGELLLNDRPLHDWRPAHRARMLACLPQQSTLNFPFTVEEVALMGRIPHDTGAKQDRDVVRQALDAVDGWQLAGRRYTELSGGEKQRVQLARVLAQVWQAAKIDGQERSRALLLDEPSASLDIAHQQLLKTIVRGMARQGVAVVMVMHSMNIALNCADRLVVMSEGRLMAQGTPDELTQGSLLQTVFGVDLQFMAHPSTGKPVAIME